MFEGWPRDQWCKDGCILDKIPEWVVNVWELMWTSSSVRPVSAGMAAYFEVDYARLEKSFLEDGGDKEDFLFVRTFVEEMFYIWEKEKRPNIDEKDIKLFEEIYELGVD